MNIPTYEQRIQAKFGDEKDTINRLINKVILEGDQRTNNYGQNYYTVDMEDYPHSELVDYMVEQYKKAGWRVEFFRRDRDEEREAHVDIYQHYEEAA